MAMLPTCTLRHACKPAPWSFFRSALGLRSAVPLGSCQACTRSAHDFLMARTHRQTSNTRQLLLHRDFHRARDLTTDAVIHPVITCGNDATWIPMSPSRRSTETHISSTSSTRLLLGRGRPSTPTAVPGLENSQTIANRSRQQRIVDSPVLPTLYCSPQRPVRAHRFRSRWSLSFGTSKGMLLASNRRDDRLPGRDIFVPVRLVLASLGSSCLQPTHAHSTLRYRPANHLDGYSSQTVLVWPCGTSSAVEACIVGVLAGRLMYRTIDRLRQRGGPSKGQRDTSVSTLRSLSDVDMYSQHSFETDFRALQERNQHIRPRRWPRFAPATLLAWHEPHAPLRTCD